MAYTYDSRPSINVHYNKIILYVKLNCYKTLHCFFKFYISNPFRQKNTTAKKKKAIAN